MPRGYWFPKALRGLLLAVLIVGCALYVAIPDDFELINPYGMPQFLEFLTAALRPDLSGEFLGVAWNAAWVTLSYALIGTGLSLVFGFLGACATSSVVVDTVWPWLSQLGVQRSLKLALTLPRSLHEVIWGLLLINLVGLDPIAGILAIAIPYGAIVAKIFAEILDDTPRDALENLLNAGCRPIAAIAYGLLPRAKLSLMSYGFYRFECSLRSAAILGVIGAGGLGYQMMLSLDSLRYSQLWTLFYAIFLLNGAVDLLSAYARHRMGAPKRFELKQSLRSERRNSFQRRSNIVLSGGVSVCLSILWIGAWHNLHPHPSLLWSREAWSTLLALNPSFSVMQIYFPSKIVL